MLKINKRVRTSSLKPAAIGHVLFQKCFASQACYHSAIQWVAIALVIAKNISVRSKITQTNMQEVNSFLSQKIESPSSLNIKLAILLITYTEIRVKYAIVAIGSGDKAKFIFVRNIVDFL